MEGSGKKSDFLGLYEGQASCSNLADYDASLLTRGKQSGMCTFIAPNVEGAYVIRLVRNDAQELASLRFRVVRDVKDHG